MRLNGSLHTVGLLLLGLLAAADLGAQAPTAVPSADVAPAQEAEPPRAVYLLNANDQVVIRAQDVEEISERPFRIDSDGYLNLPIVGRVRAQGLTVEQLETLLADRLRIFIQNPQVVVSVIETARQQEVANPVFLVGAFKAPGVFALGARTETLSEVLMKTGGLQPTANRRLRVVRRIEQGRLDLPMVSEVSDGKTTYAEVLLTATGELVNPAENIQLKPFDALIATKNEPIYVAGQVARAGAFPLEDREFLSATQILALAGAMPNADIANAKVLRPVQDTAQRAEIHLNLLDVVAGRANDFPLMANDVLYIPAKKGGFRSGLARVGTLAIPATVTSIIWITLRRR
jgi:polysaccharide biosynthesis/export protein